jgi:hypothetical protein
MTEQQGPDEEVEGHSKRFYQDPDAPEGSEEDVEGSRFSQEEGSADDVAGHGAKLKLDPEGVGEDVEGHVWRGQ